MYLTWYPQVCVLGGVTIHTGCRRVRLGEIHDNPSEVAVFLGSGEQDIHLAPRSECLSQHSPLSHLCGYVADYIADVVASRRVIVSGCGRNRALVTSWKPESAEFHHSDIFVGINHLVLGRKLQI